MISYLRQKGKGVGGMGIDLFMDSGPVFPCSKSEWNQNKKPTNQEDLHEWGQEERGRDPGSRRRRQQCSWVSKDEDSQLAIWIDVFMFYDQTIRIQNYTKISKKLCTYSHNPWRRESIIPNGVGSFSFWTKTPFSVSCLCNNITFGQSHRNLLSLPVEDYSKKILNNGWCL